MNHGLENKDPVLAITLLIKSCRLANRDQKRFTILDVAADWYELILPQGTMQPFIASISIGEQLDLRFAVSRHTTAPISHSRFSTP